VFTDLAHIGLLLKLPPLHVILTRLAVPSSLGIVMSKVAPAARGFTFIISSVKDVA
jgi:hypothetical protein